MVKDPVCGMELKEEAAAATRTFARVANHMPRNPIDAEKPAPNRKKMLRPSLTPPSPGSSSSSATTTSTGKVACAISGASSDRHGPSKPRAIFQYTAIHQNPLTFTPSNSKLNSVRNIRCRELI